MRKIPEEFAKQLASVLLLLLLAGCNSKNENRVEKNRLPSEAASAQSSRSAGNAIKLEMSQEPKSDSGPDSNLNEPSQAFLPHNVRDRLLPSDFEIGELQDRQASSQDELAIIRIIVRFCNALTRGKLISDLIENDKQAILANAISYHLSKGSIPRNYRIGRVKIDKKDASEIPVRFFSKTGVTEGHLYLVKTNAGWLISDVQISFQELSEIRKKREEKFAPSSHAWVINGF